MASFTLYLCVLLFPYKGILYRSVNNRDKEREKQGSPGPIPVDKGCQQVVTGGNKNPEIPHPLAGALGDSWRWFRDTDHAVMLLHVSGLHVSVATVELIDLPARHDWDGMAEAMAAAVRGGETGLRYLLESATDSGAPAYELWAIEGDAPPFVTWTGTADA